MKEIKPFKALAIVKKEIVLLDLFHTEELSELVLNPGEKIVEIEIKALKIVKEYANI